MIYNTLYKRIWTDELYLRQLYLNIAHAAGNFQNSKLADLQRVLQSDFFNAVREVYEHVYETVEMQGSPEVRANATAKVRKVMLLEICIFCL